MLDEKKKIDISNYKMQAMLNNGQDIVFGNEEIDGIDKPVEAGAIAFLEV